MTIGQIGSEYRFLHFLITLIIYLIIWIWFNFKCYLIINKEKKYLTQNSHQKILFSREISSISFIQFNSIYTKHSRQKAGFKIPKWILNKILKIKELFRICILHNLFVTYVYVLIVANSLKYVLWKIQIEKKSKKLKYANNKLKNSFHN